MERDLFGAPTSEKNRRRRSSKPDKSVGNPKSISAVPGLSDLVARLRPLHRRVEADLRRIVAGDLAAQQRVERRCQNLSQEQGVTISPDQYLHTAATVYVLKALFLRVAEDYGLFPGPARKVALRGDICRALRDLAPRFSWSDYLEYALRDLAYLPMAYDLFKETAYEAIPPGDEEARDLLDTVAGLPDLREMDTRTLGDLYEHLMDEGERKRLGYYTTPDFIIDFLQERTLEPAVRDFGVHELRYLDPACGTGHFLVRACRRLDAHLALEDPDLTPLERFERIVENNLFGIDISEFATRITLFRLFLEGLRLAGAEGLSPAQWGQDITFNVYTANSLVKPPQSTLPLFEPGRPPGRQPDPVARRYGRELTHLRVDLHDALAKGFHVVNANPPYVRIHRQEAEVVAPVNSDWKTVDFVQYLRDSYKTTHSQFDLSVPFVERGLELLVPGGYLGYITSGKFAKQAYGRKLAARLAGTAYRLLLYADLTDAQVFQAGTYPALLVLQRPADGALVSGEARVEVLATYRTAGGMGEEHWATLRALLAQEETFGEHAGHYYERQAHFREHPWTVRRGPQDLLARIQAVSNKTLVDHVESIGEDFQTNADPIFCDYITESFIRRYRLERELCLPCLRGENIRNWTVTWHGNRKREQTYVIATGVGLIEDIDQYPNVARYLLRYRPYLEVRRIYGNSLMKIRRWYEFWWWGARLGVPKIEFAAVVTHGHFYLDRQGRYVLRHSAQAMYFPEPAPISPSLLLGVLNSSIGTFLVRKFASRLQHGYVEFVRKSVGKIPIPEPNGELWNAVGHKVAEISTLVSALDELSIHNVLRRREFKLVEELRALTGEANAEYGIRLGSLQNLQKELDELVATLYGLDGTAMMGEIDRYRRPWSDPAFEDELYFEVRDYICDLIENRFAAQQPLHERPLSPGEIAGLLAQNPKFEPLRAIYYGGKPISAEQFVRECMDWDCRPIPFDQEAVLVGRKPKRVDVLHERFFRFDGVNRDLYGWTGWSPEAQANVFLTLAEQAQDKTPFYRWVARLISLPEESPDIADPEVKEGLRAIIGDAEPYPYVVMDRQ